MRIYLLYIILILLSCEKIKLDLPETEYRIQSELAFNTIQTKAPKFTASLNEVEVFAELQDNETPLTIEKRGFFYSTDFMSMYGNNGLSINDFASLDSIRTWKESIESTIEGNGFKSKIIFDFEDLGKEFYLRAYVKFSFEGAIRDYIADDDTIRKISLTDGWFEKNTKLKIDNIQNAIAIPNPTGTMCIVGTGCPNNNSCKSNIRPYSFLSFPKEEESNCPKEINSELVFNRHRGVGFWIKDSIYFGMGEIDNIQGSRDFFAYNPENCSATISKKLPDKIKGRIDAIGFAIGNYGYLGLGRDTTGNPLSDIWQFDPTTQNWSQVKILNENGFEMPIPKREAAIGFTVNQKYAVIGGGLADGRGADDMWKFIPNPADTTAILEPLGNLGIGEFIDGIGFSINGEIYLGLGFIQGKDNFFKFNNNTKNWIPVTPFPESSVWNGVGFSLNNRGYLVTGLKSKGSSFINTPWVYIPEKK